MRAAARTSYHRAGRRVHSCEGGYQGAGTGHRKGRVGVDVQERERQPAAAVTATRAAWGLLLLTRPRTVARVLNGNPTPSPAARRLLRVLGLRHLFQAAGSTTGRRTRCSSEVRWSTRCTL